jgi:hypothetical protein
MADSFLRRAARGRNNPLCGLAQPERMRFKRDDYGKHMHDMGSYGGRGAGLCRVRSRSRSTRSAAIPAGGGPLLAAERAGGGRRRRAVTVHTGCHVLVPPRTPTFLGSREREEGAAITYT